MRCETSLVGFSQSGPIQPILAEPYTVGKSSCSSVASRVNIRSNTFSCAISGVQFSLSTLFTTKMGFNPNSMALPRTKRVCGIGPSKASTTSRTASAIFKTRSTSPPKSAWPGVSRMLILTPFQLALTFLDRMVIPRSRSRSLLSRINSPVSFRESTAWHWWMMLSTRVVLPWSTWAMMAMFRMPFMGWCEGEIAFAARRTCRLLQNTTIPVLFLRSALPGWRNW